HYSFNLNAEGGSPPYTWSAASLPNGLVMNGNGMLMGTQTESGMFTPSISVQDSVQTVTTVTFNLGGDTRLPLVSAPSLTPGSVRRQRCCATPDVRAPAEAGRVRGGTSTHHPALKAAGITSHLTPAPIGLGSDAEQVYFTLYGTGLRLRSNLDAVHVFIGNVL